MVSNTRNRSEAYKKKKKMALKCVQGKSTIGTERSGYYNIGLSNEARRSLRKKGVTNSRALNCNRRQCDVARDDMSSIKLLKYFFFGKLSRSVKMIHYEYY